MNVKSQIVSFSNFIVMYSNISREAKVCLNSILVPLTPYSAGSSFPATYLTISEGLASFSASLSGISKPNSSSIAIITSTWSSESSPKSWIKCESNESYKSKKLSATAADISGRDQLTTCLVSLFHDFSHYLCSRQFIVFTDDSHHAGLDFFDVFGGVLDYLELLLNMNLE